RLEGGVSANLGALVRRRTRDQGQMDAGLAGVSRNQRAEDAEAVSANFSAEERRILSRSPNAKPESADRMDERVGLLAVDFAADPPDIDVEGVGGGLKLDIPYMLQQHCAGDDLAFIAHQTFEDLVFSRQQIDDAAAAAHCARHEVEL